MNIARSSLGSLILLVLPTCYAWSQDNNASDTIYRLPPVYEAMSQPAEERYVPPSPAGPEFGPPANPNPYSYAADEQLPPPTNQYPVPQGNYDNTPPLATPLPQGSGPDSNGTYSPGPYSPAGQGAPPAQYQYPPPGNGVIAAEPSADEAAAQAVVEEVLPPVSLWYSYWDPWEGNVELGMNGTQGNTQTFNIRVGANAKYKAETWTHAVQAVFLEKSVNEVNTAQNALLDSRIEWPWEGSPWNVFVHGLGEYDQFKAFDGRLSGDAGLGYEWIQTEFTTFQTRSGVAVSHEIGGPESDIIPEFLAGMEYKHKFSELHSISFKTDYYPAMEDVRDFRLNTQASWEMAVAPEWGLSLKFSVIDRYDSTPHGAKPNDLDYSTLLIWGF